MPGDLLVVRVLRKQWRQFETLVYNQFPPLAGGDLQSGAQGGRRVGFHRCNSYYMPIQSCCQLLAVLTLTFWHYRHFRPGYDASFSSHTCHSIYIASDRSRYTVDNGGGFLCDHLPNACKAIWDFEGIYCSSRSGFCIFQPLLHAKRHVGSHSSLVWLQAHSRRPICRWVSIIVLFYLTAAS